MAAEFQPPLIPFFDPSWTGGSWQTRLRSTTVPFNKTVMAFDGNGHRIAYWFRMGVNSTAMFGFSADVGSSHGIPLFPTSGSALVEITWAKHGGAVFEPIYVFLSGAGSSPCDITEVLYLPTGA
jgi:hypothetical protein